MFPPLLADQGTDVHSVDHPLKRRLTSPRASLEKRGQDSNAPVFAKMMAVASATKHRLRASVVDGSGPSKVMMATPEAAGFQRDELGAKVVLHI